MNSEGYRKEFGENGDSVIHVDSSVKRRIQIGVPTENDQIRIINEVLISFGKAHGEIKSIHFLMKKEDGVANYLLCYRYTRGRFKEDFRASLF